MNEIIKISCPVCGHVVMVRNSENVEKKMFKCPVCNNKSKIGDSKIIGYDDAPANAPKKDAPGQPQAPKSQPSAASIPNIPSFRPNGQFQPQSSAQTQPISYPQSQPQAAQAPGVYAQVGEIVKVKCGCGLVLSFKYKPGAEKSFLICPKCQRKNQISHMERVGGKFDPIRGALPRLENVNPGPRNNPYPGYNNPYQGNTGAKSTGSIPLPPDQGSFNKERDRTRIPGIDDYVGLGGFNPLANELKNQPIANLRVKGQPITYQLSRGRNVIGKKVDTSKATIQIETESRRMSREHLVIETQETPNGIAYYISLFKEKVNPTFLDNNPLEYGDKIRIESGAEIRIPENLTILFEIPGNDHTQLR